MAIRLVIADDHPIVLAGMHEILSGEADFHIVATCSNADQTLDAVRRFQPEVLLLDLTMPHKDGLAVLRELSDAHSPTKVIVFSATLNSDKAVAAMALGARCLLYKDVEFPVLLKSIRQVARGETWVDPHLSTKMVETILSDPSARRRALTASLTPREHQLVRLVVDGLRNKEIAGQLGIQEGSVKSHLFRVYQKLGVTNRVELVLHAQLSGLT